MTRTRLEQEIREQPAAAASLLERLVPQLPALAAHLRSAGTREVLLVARGSSGNAACYAGYLWGSGILGPPVRTLPAAPSLTTVYGSPAPAGEQAVVAVSQSGRSPDVVAVVEQARAAGRPTLAITNDPTSPLAVAAGVVVDLGVGPERSVAATKTYTSSLVVLAGLGAALAGGGGDAGDAGGPAAALLEDLRGVPDALARVLEAYDDGSGAPRLERAVDLLTSADRAVAVGRGVNLATARETALKVTELTGTLVAPYSPADLMHGPVAALGPSVPVLAVAPDERASASVLEVLPELRRRGAPVVLLGRASGEPGTHGLPLPVEPGAEGGPDWLTPVSTVVLGQLLAWRLAERRGVDVDRPGELSKVTLTT